jgi:hypothetical protein
MPFHPPLPLLRATKPPVEQDPTRCKYCGVSKSEHGVETDTGDKHTVEACREYVSARLERAIATLRVLDDTFIALSDIQWSDEEGIIPAARRAIDIFIHSQAQNPGPSMDG